MGHCRLIIEACDCEILLIDQKSRPGAWGNIGTTQLPVESFANQTQTTVSTGNMKNCGWEMDHRTVDVVGNQPQTPLYTPLPVSTSEKWLKHVIKWNKMAKMDEMVQMGF